MVLKYWTGYIHTGIFGIHPDTTGSRPRSLRGLAAIFLQKRLDKEQRLSDWQQSSLTQAGSFLRIKISGNMYLVFAYLRVETGILE